ncbi:hypothetical protein [Pseudomonas viridiflava]|uniref:hypothetical protein n=1 Tax=Pseudomonas viridiflava TaxID=33069 RepID=UPI002A6AC058|nr:hypothetical protein [Pseudomonas viridiflava]MDY0937937.1 hypothetical protein [Pseudomonas viridiflava]MDY1014764.1 hypothetical protein [Pseudomonas viridiflava]
MIWYGLENGQLRTLRKMLEAPLEFDPVDFIERTFQDPGNKPAEETLEIALSYNLLKTQLITSLNKIHYCLSNTAKLNFENLGDDSTPLGYELLMRPQSASIKEALRMRVCDGTNLYLDRLLDSFKIKDCRGSKPNSQLHDVIKLYFLSEVLFFLLTNTATAVREGDSIFIAPASPEIVKQFHRKWFANRWEQNSCIANIAYLDILPKGANNNSYFFDAIAMFGEKLVDKIFFLPVDKLPGRLERSPYIQWIKKLCTLAILCMWCKTKNDMEYAPRDWINKIGISNDDVEKIKYYSSSQSEPDQVFDVGNNGISIGNPSITIQLRHTLDFIARNVTDSTFNNMVGDFFEKTCIIGYFEDDEIRKNYSAFTGFVPGDVRDESLKPDIDLIIKDIHRNKYYFAQVKYMRIGGKAYISGDIDHLVSGALHKGMRQLVDAKTALQDGKLKHILLEKGLHDCTPENSYFLLIHNVYNFDFTVWPQSIISYEWNSLRNILRCGMVNYGLSNGPATTWQHSSVLPFEDPDSLIEHYINNSPSSVESSIGTIFDADNLVVHVDLGGTQIRCQGLGL